MDFKPSGPHGAPMPDQTLTDVLLQAAREHGDRPAFLLRGAAPMTWADVAARAQRIAQGLLSMGLRPGERVAIVSDTRAEWALADAAILMCGGVTVSVFSTLTPEQTSGLLRDSRARFAFLEDERQWQKLAPHAEALPIGRFVLFDGAPAHGKRLARLSDVEAEGAAHATREPGMLAERIARARPDDVATLIYTSGTTGKPKGVVLTHRNFVASAEASIAALGLKRHCTGLAFLPLAHSYQRQNAVVVTMLAGSVAFTTPSRLAEELRAVRPTILPAVPRLYERMHERIHQTVARMPPHRRAIFRAAERAARAYGERALTGAPIPRGLALRHALFEALVYRRLRRQAGLDRLELAVTGAAAMRPDLLSFFHGIGVPIMEGWGLSETTAPATVNRPGAARLGTVGPPLPGVEVALDDDGEVLVAGPIVFQGYDGMPEDTREAFLERDGKRWFRTGDIGAFDEAGHLRIVDRKKDLEVLDTGKKVAPMPIEEALKASPWIAEALVVATDRKFVAALVQPDLERALSIVRVDDARVERGRGPSGDVVVVRVPEEVARDERLRAKVAEAVEGVNATLAPHERIREFRLVSEAWREETGALTPTLKKRRRVILQRHAALVEELFSGKPK